MRKFYPWKTWKNLQKQKHKRIGLQIYICTYACLKTRVQSFSVKIIAEENKRPWLTSVCGQKHSMYFRGSPNKTCFNCKSTKKYWHLQLILLRINGKIILQK